MNISLFFVLSVLAFSGVGALAADAEEEGGRKISVWTRASGNYTNRAEVKRWGSHTVVIGNKDLRNREMFDVQYDEKHTYRGVPLLELVTSAVAGAPAKGRVDTALLHFKNGMIVPLSLGQDFRDVRTLKALVAVGWRDGRRGKFSSSFPIVAKKSDRWRDPRPVTFGGNKLVVPSVETKEGADFSPWKHVTTLTGIELVNAEAYYRQFALKKKGVDDGVGLGVFVDRCQFCHGVLLVGATFGWDWLDPIPLYELKKPEHIFNRVKYRYHDELQRGLLMPPQQDVEKGEMYVLWGWLKGLGRQQKLQDYRP